MQSNANYTNSLQYALFLMVILCTVATGKIIYVDAGASGANDGTSWVNAYNYLQDALSDAKTADKPTEILVAKGIYKTDQGATMTLSDRSATFQLINGVSIFGGYAGFGEADPNKHNIELYQTTLSGDLNDDDIEVISSDDLADEQSRAENSYQIVTSSGTNETAILDGFTIMGGNADVFTDHNGGGLLNEYGSPQIFNCTFSKNSAQYYGGGIYNYYGNPMFINCTFIQNSAGTGGGIYNFYSNPEFLNCTFTQNSSGGIKNIGGNLTITNCTFTGNRANGRGGGIYCSGANSSLTNCIFSKNSADYAGGGIYFTDSDPNLTGCSFIENLARYGGGLYNNDSNLRLTCCKFIANVGYDYGGGMCNLSGNNLSLDNCIFIANRANSYGGGMYNNSSDLSFTHCTLTENSARNGSTIAFNSHNQHGQSIVGIIDCILWDIGEAIWINDLSTITISYSDIRSGWIGTGNIDTDPLFTDPNGSDGIPGTEDDDLQIAPSSPCVDAGDPNYAPGPNKKDIAGNLRVIGGGVDMGAYESQGIIYVDNKGISDPEQGDLREDGSLARPFDTIQEAIDVAKDGQTVLVRPGVYSAIDFMGKAITVAGTEGAAMIGALDTGRTGLIKRDAVTFHTGEGPDSVLKNFIIKNSSIAISLNYGSSPTIRNLTIVDNNFGIAAYENSNPDISNCIFWNNRDGDLFQCEARYSCLEDETPGVGNISANPLFVDPDNGDYHLMSEGWRWSTYEESWVYDEVTSSCIDAGDPGIPLGDEPLSTPRDPDNEFGINLYINMGAYGGTCQASMAPPYWFPGYETDPPEPNPAQWARDGKPREEGILGSNRIVEYWIKMIAAEASDVSEPVKYFFECTTEAGFSSGWQRSRSYEVYVGSRGQGHRFRVKARDRFGNETEWSEELTAN